MSRQVMVQLFVTDYMILYTGYRLPLSCTSILLWERQPTPDSGACQVSWYVRPGKWYNRSTHVCEACVLYAEEKVA
jgi:hypothetical protein